MTKIELLKPFLPRDVFNGEIVHQSDSSVDMASFIASDATGFTEITDRLANDPGGLDRWELYLEEKFFPALIRPILENGGFPLAPEGDKIDALNIVDNNQAAAVLTALRQQEGLEKRHMQEAGTVRLGIPVAVALPRAQSFCGKGTNNGKETVRSCHSDVVRGGELVTDAATRKRDLCQERLPVGDSVVDRANRRCLGHRRSVS